MENFPEKIIVNQSNFYLLSPKPYSSYPYTTLGLCSSYRHQGFTDTPVWSLFEVALTCFPSALIFLGWCFIALLLMVLGYISRQKGVKNHNSVMSVPAVPVIPGCKINSVTRPNINKFNHLIRQQIKLDMWKEAQYTWLMNKSRSKVAVISAWELQETRKAKQHMDKIEGVVKKKLEKAEEKMMKKINEVNIKAQAMKEEEKVETSKKISEVFNMTEKHHHSKCNKLLAVSRPMK